MCTFITLIAATDDLNRVNAILATFDRRGHIRRAERVETSGLNSLLKSDEREYWLFSAPCDCGTFIGSARQYGRNLAAVGVANALRYRRKGWSEARIARALAEKERASLRTPTHRSRDDDAAYWISLMTQLGEGLRLKTLGLMHHFYNGFVGQEPENAIREEAGAIADAASVLAHMQDGVIYDFKIRH